MTKHTLLFILVFCAFNLSAQKYIAQYNKGNYEKSLKLADKAIDENAKDLDAYLYKSLSYMHLGSEEEFKADYPFGIESSLSTLRFLTNKDKNKTYLPAHKTQADSIITTASEFVFELYNDQKFSRVEKMIDKLIELSPKPEHYYIKGKLLQEEGEDREAIKAFNTAAGKIYLDYKKGLIPEPYLYETFIALANSLYGDYDFKSAAIIYCRALDIFKSAEVEDACFEFLSSEESRLFQWTDKATFDEFIFYTDSVLDLTADKTPFIDLKWNAIRIYYSSLIDKEEYLLADSLMMAQGCGISTGKYFVLGNIIDKTNAVYNLQQNKVIGAEDEFRIFLDLLDCDQRGLSNEKLAASMIDSFINASDFISASKLIYNLKNISTDKTLTSQLEERLYNSINLLSDSATAEIDLYQIFQYFPANKKFKLLQQNSSILAIEKLIRDKKFTQAGEMLRKQSHLYPNDASVKSLYRIWAIEDYKANYLGSDVDYSKLGWTGNYDDCNPGTIPSEVNQKLLQRLNYVRRLAGVPDECVLNDEWNKKCMAAALMMGANGKLSHSPPSDWKCYSADGATGAGNSNLSLGASDVDALMGQLDDGGIASVGHRRWILDPYRHVYGHGSNGYSMALWALGGDNSDYPEALTDKFETQFVAWPPEGFLPSPFRTQYWSFALENCNFDSTKVEMWIGDTPVDLTILKQEFGYGQNTLVWYVEDPTPSFGTEITYTVKLKDVIVYSYGKYSGNSETAVRDFSYTVTFIPVSSL